MDDFTTDSFFDNADFSDNGSSFEPAPVTASEPQAQPEQPSIDPNELATLRQEVASTQKWQQDFARFADTMAGRQPQQQQPDPTARLAELVNNPAGFEQSIIERAQNEFRQSMVWDSAIDNARQTYPHLAPFEQAIHSESNVNEAIHNFAKTNGRAPQPGAETVKAAIENFEKKLQGYQPQAQGQLYAQQLKNQALSLTPGNAQQTQGKLTPEAITAMSSDDFAALRHRAINRA